MSVKELDFCKQHRLLLKSSSGIMLDACVVFGCSRTADPQRGIRLHRIAFFDDPCEEIIKRRRKWVNFVQERRAKWEPTKHSKICSLHFKREYFTGMFTLLSGQKIPSSPRLKEDNLGPCVFPSIQANSPEFKGSATKPQSARAKMSIARKVRNSTSTLLIEILKLYTYSLAFAKSLKFSSLFISFLFLDCQRDASVKQHENIYCWQGKFCKR